MKRRLVRASWVWSGYRAREARGSQRSAGGPRAGWNVTGALEPVTGVAVAASSATDAAALRPNGSAAANGVAAGWCGVTSPSRAWALCCTADCALAVHCIHAIAAWARACVAPTPATDTIGSRANANSAVRNERARRVTMSSRYRPGATTAMQCYFAATICSLSTRSFSRATGSYACAFARTGFSWLK